MSRSLARLIAILGVLVLFPAVAMAQGLLIHIQPDDRVPLPRPIIIHPPHPYPRPTPRPRPVPQPESTYKIKELEVHAKLADQVAQVQVSQSFVNTGSRQMEVCFVFPLPYDGAIDQLTLLVDGKEYPGQAARRQGSPPAIRGDRPQEPGPGPAGMDGHGHVQDERLPGAAGRRAQGHAPLQPALPQGPTG